MANEHAVFNDADHDRPIHVYDYSQFVQPIHKPSRFLNLSHLQAMDRGKSVSATLSASRTPRAMPYPINTTLRRQ